MEACLSSRESAEDITPPQIVAAAVLALVFVFCIVRTVGSLWGHSADSSGFSTAHRAVPPVPRAVGPSVEGLSSPPPPVDEPLSEVRWQRFVVRTDGDNPGAIIVAAHLVPDMAAGKVARYRPRVVVRPPRAPKIVVVAPPPAPVPFPTPVMAAPPEPPPPLAATSIVLRGRVMRPGVSGPVPLRNSPVTLYGLLDAQVMEGRTDLQGFYAFEGLQPGAMYYVIATFEDELRMGHGGYGRPPGVGGWGGASEPEEQKVHLSWHQAVDAPSQPGVYALDLGPDNADPEYCPDLRPTNDPVTRSPFRSWRRAALQPF